MLLDRVSRRDPFLAQFESLVNGLSRPAAAGAHGFAPAADVYETETHVVIALDVPGVAAEDLSAEITDGQLVVTGKREPAADAARRFRAERWYGSFVRSFRLPDGLAGVDVEASYADGVLTLSLPKPGEATPKRIEISRSAHKEIAA
jgi:HSP20 family protein